MSPCIVTSPPSHQISFINHLHSLLVPAAVCTITSGLWLQQSQGHWLILIALVPPWSFIFIIKLFYYIPQFNCLHTRRVVFCNYHFVEIFNILIAKWQTNTPFIALSQISFVNNMSFRLCWWDAVWWLQNKEAARRCQANNWTEASPRPGLWEWQRQAGLGGTRHGSGQTNGSVYI